MAILIMPYENGFPEQVQIRARDLHTRFMNLLHRTKLPTATE